MRDHRDPREVEERDEAPFGEPLPEDDVVEDASDELLEDPSNNDVFEEEAAFVADDELTVEPQESLAETPAGPSDNAGDQPSEDTLVVPPLEDIEEALTEPPEDRVPPLILVSAVIGLVVGLFVWGSLAMSVMSSTEGVIEDLSTDSEGAFDMEEADLVIDCSDTGPPPFASAEQRAAFEARCASPTPAAAETPAPDPALNRADCDAIRGTDYRSVEERQWFLENCVEG